MILNIIIGGLVVALFWQIYACIAMWAYYQNREFIDHRITGIVATVLGIVAAVIYKFSVVTPGAVIGTVLVMLALLIGALALTSWSDPNIQLFKHIRWSWWKKPRKSSGQY